MLQAPVLPSTAAYRGSSAYRPGQSGKSQPTPQELEQRKGNRYWLGAAAAAVAIYLFLGGMIQLQLESGEDDGEDLDAQTAEAEDEGDDE